MEYDAEFYEQVLSRVVNFSEYDSYGRNPRHAARSIRKKYPRLDLSECEAAFLKVLTVYDEAAALIERHYDDFWNMYRKTRGKELVPESHRLSLAQRHPWLPESVIHGMLSWIFFWRHLK